MTRRRYPRTGEHSYSGIGAGREHSAGRRPHRGNVGTSPAFPCQSGTLDLTIDFRSMSARVPLTASGCVRPNVSCGTRKCSQINACMSPLNSLCALIHAVEIVSPRRAGGFMRSDRHIPQGDCFHRAHGPSVGCLFFSWFSRVVGAITSDGTYSPFLGTTEIALLVED